MVRGGRSGYRDHKRNLVYPLTQERARIVQLENPTAAETAALHTIEYILNRSDTVDCYQFSTASELAAALGRVWPPEPAQPPRPPSPPPARRQATRERTRSPPEFPDFPGNPHRVLVRSDPPRESAAAPSSSSSRRARSPVTVPAFECRLIQRTNAREAVQELREIVNSRSLVGATRILAVFDFHGVLDKDFWYSASVITNLKQCGVDIACLSFARAADTVQRSHAYLENLCRETSVSIPFIVASQPLVRQCRFRGDWAKANFFVELLQSEPDWKVFFTDDRWDILQDIRQQTRSDPRLRLVLCDSTLVSAVGQWASAGKGLHFLDPRDIRVVRYHD